MTINESIQHLIDMSTKVGELRARHNTTMPMPDELYAAMQEVIELRAALIEQFGAIEAELRSWRAVGAFVTGPRGTSFLVNQDGDTVEAE